MLSRPGAPIKQPRINKDTYKSPLSFIISALFEHPHQALGALGETNSHHRGLVRNDHRTQQVAAAMAMVARNIKAKHSSAQRSILKVILGLGLGGGRGVLEDGHLCACVCVCDCVCVCACVYIWHPVDCPTFVLSLSVSLTLSLFLALCLEYRHMCWTTTHHEHAPRTQQTAAPTKHVSVVPPQLHYISVVCIPPSAFTKPSHITVDDDTTRKPHNRITDGRSSGCGV